MKVKTLGFELLFATGVTVGDFYQRLERIEDKEIEIKSRRTVLYTDVIHGLICGLVISYKDNKKSLVTLRDDSGDLMVSKKTLSKNEYGTEVSLFAINPINLRGLFYSYQGSVSPVGLSSLFKKSHDEELRFKKNQYQKELTEFGKKSIKEIGKRVLEKYPGAFSLSLLATPADLSQVLSNYKEVRKIRLMASNALSDAGRYTPLDENSKRATIEVDFERGSLIKGISSVVKNVFKPYAKQQEETSLRIYGLGHYGEDLAMQVGDNTSNFGRMEYDEYVELLPGKKWKEYKNCDAMKNLISKMRDNSVVFGEVPSVDSWKIISAKDIKNKASLPQDVPETESS
ncbi:hypothetical protein ACJJI3_15940 [Microbulbifer sp. ZKSA004]|uniref:hypothetical protein n=1 Tax=Microbulbifer sp. ZKSA004 TaxID=3243389 RepID=UPI004039AE11